MTNNFRWSYRQCPGVPGIISHCNKQLRSRILCEDCERSAILGRAVTEKKCPGVPAIGHTCRARIRNKPRCRTCEALWQKYQADVGFKKNRVERKCLRCDKPFVTYNKFVRLCKRCKNTNSSSEYAGLSAEHYSVNIRPQRNGGHA